MKMLAIGAIAPSSIVAKLIERKSRRRIFRALPVLAALCVSEPLSAEIRITDLGTLGGAFSGPTAVNARGQVVGVSTTATDERHPFLWENGTITDLGTLNAPPQLCGITCSEATAINDRGQVVGFTRTATGQAHAFLWENGTITDLGTLGGAFSTAQAINARGQVAGSSTTAAGQEHGSLWDITGKLAGF